MSRGVPREARRLLERARDYAESAIDVHEVERARHALGIDRRGLRDEDREIVRLLIARGPMGIDAIAATLGQDRDTVASIHEPFLLREGYVERTPRGRMATRKARSAYGAPSANGRTFGIPLVGVIRGTVV